MMQHRHKGAIHDHFMEKHGDKPTLAELLENTKIINKVSNKRILYIAEAVAIEIRKPKLNVQKKFDYTLPSNRKFIHTPPIGQTDNTRVPGEEPDQELQEGTPIGGEGEEPRDDAPDSASEDSSEPEVVGHVTNQRRLRPLPHRLV